MLSLRLLADSDMVRYRKCGALSNAHKSAPMQTYVKDMSIPPLVVEPPLNLLVVPLFELHSHFPKLSQNCPTRYSKGWLMENSYCTLRSSQQTQAVRGWCAWRAISERTAIGWSIRLSRQIHQPQTAAPLPQTVTDELPEPPLPHPICRTTSPRLSPVSWATRRRSSYSGVSRWMSW